jgi:uncharacterized protein YggE
MAAKQRERGGGSIPPRFETEAQTRPVAEAAGSQTPQSKTMREDKVMAQAELQPQMQQRKVQMEGITVIGEAVRRITPETAEFLIEISTSAPNAAQALRDNHAKTTQLVQALAPLGVQAADLQSISLNVYNLYAPLLPGQGSYGSLPQVGQAGFSPYGSTPGVQPSLQPEVQFGAYHARNTVRVNVREPGRVGEVVDATTRAGAAVLGGFSFRVSDEAHARRAALDAAGKDARAKAEALAASAGRQVGDAIAISEDLVASNGDYAALRATLPFAFGAGAPRVIGELEYYARVSANFRFQ